MSTVDLPNIREPFIDPRSGQISRPWWIWLQQLMARVGGAGGTDISVIEALVRQLIKDVVALERVAIDNPQGQINAGLALQIEELQAFAGSLYRGHGFWEDPDMHAAATTSAAGFMSASDKITLDGLAGSSVATSRQIIAGAGLTGGGDLSADRTLNVAANADGSITVNANDVQIGVLATDAQHGNRGGGALHAAATTSVAGFMAAADKQKVDDVASSYFFAYRSSGQAISAATSTTIVADTEVYDALGEYNSATGVFTAQSGGFYIFSGRVNGTQTTATTRTLQLFVNGVETIRMQQKQADNGNCVIAGDSGLVGLSAGDQVTMRYFSVLADTATAGSAFTNFSGWRVR
jgi:hypothetical protein